MSAIKNLLKKSAKPVGLQTKFDNNIWFNKDKLVSTKVAPAESILVVNKSQRLNNDSVEKAIVDNAIPVTKSYNNASGDLVIVCDTPDSRDKLKDIISSTTENIQMKSITRKKPSITIVGLSKKYKKEEVVSQIVSQNQFVKHFCTVNNINEHIEIHDIKPTRSKPFVYQVFASVSETLRKGLRNYNDKIVIGLTNCKIYDRFHVKRCNNCQGYGHYYKECPTPNAHCCAKCGLNHPTNSCEGTVKKCINCSKVGIADVNHTAYDPTCPSLLSQVEKKKKWNEKHLNLRRPPMD